MDTQQTTTSPTTNDVPVAAAGEASSAQPGTSADAATLGRIKSLGEVGTALVEMSNGRNFDTNIFSARTALQEFRDGIAKLNLEPQLQKGMDDLMKILEDMLGKKMQDTFDTPQQNF